MALLKCGTRTQLKYFLRIIYLKKKLKKKNAGNWNTIGQLIRFEFFGPQTNVYSDECVIELHGNQNEQAKKTHTEQNKK